jgi:hypothetical protein
VKSLDMLVKVLFRGNNHTGNVIQINVDTELEKSHLHSAAIDVPLGWKY